MRTRLIVAMWVIVTGHLLWAAQAVKPTAPQVQVLPFKQITLSKSHDWIGQAIQQSLIAELSRVKGLQTGKEAGARYVISGDYQILNGEIRVSGRIIEARTGKSAGNLKMTGPVRELFWLEDMLAAQAKRHLPCVEEATKGKPGPSSESLAIRTSGPVRVAMRTQPWIGDANPANGGYAQNQVMNNYYYGRYYSYWWGCGYTPCFWGAGACFPTGFPCLMDP